MHTKTSEWIIFLRNIFIKENETVSCSVSLGLPDSPINKIFWLIMVL